MADGDTFTLIHGRGDGLGDRSACAVLAVAGKTGAAGTIMKAKTAEIRAIAGRRQWRWTEAVNWGEGKRESKTLWGFE